MHIIIGTGLWYKKINPPPLLHCLHTDQTGDGRTHLNEKFGY